MTDRYRGTLYVGVTADRPARIHRHRSGDGSDFCARFAHEKRLKRWRRQWKFDLVERGNPEWRDLCEALA